MAVSGTCGVYKYAHKKLGVIYIGHSATSVETRIRAHKSEVAFAPYLDDCCVYICSLPNKSVAIAMELLLIDHYRPVLNTYSKEDWPYTGKLPELNWTPYLAWRDTASAAAENTADEIGRRIADQRKRIGMTQKELGHLTGYTVGGISGIEAGRRSFSVEKLAAFATALHMAPGELLII